MSERWLRWYDGTVRDGKFRIVADMTDISVCTVIAIWASTLEDAATSAPRGVTSRDADHHAMYLGITAAEVERVWSALERVGAVRSVPFQTVPRNGGNGDERSTQIEVLNWCKRQFETDTKDPTAMYRKDRWKQAHSMNGTERNAQERNGTVRNTIDIDRVIYSQEEKKEEFDKDFLEFYLAYPKKKAKKDAAKAYRSARRETPHETIMAGLVRAGRSDPRWRDPQFIPYPASWLRDGCYEDEASASSARDMRIV